jgi:hypothetical protein
MTKRIGSTGYTEAELKAMIERMKDVSSAFYPAAAATGCHAFIEFTGVMNEFIKICENSLADGVDFATANTHSDTPLVVHPYNALYIAEKLDCIFGPSIRANPEVKAAFATLLDPEEEA